MPKINAASDLIATAAALTDAVAQGEVTPGEAAALSTLVGNVANVVETVEIVARLAKIEEQLTAKGSNPLGQPHGRLRPPRGADRPHSAGL